MKKIILIIIAVIAFAGCTRKDLTEKDFSVIWQEYLRREFEESFDEKQSTLQREKILAELLSVYKVSLEDFKSFMKENHTDKYHKIFLE